MRNMRLSVMALAAALVASPAWLKAADDPLKGWTVDQLKTKVLQLKKENDELRAKLASGGATAAAPAAPASADMLLDDFEGSPAKNGQAWWAGCDDNKLGTTLQPQPFVAEKGGSPASKGACGRIHGHMGTAKAPWPWASMALALANPNISGYSGISFYVKGDGGQHKVQLTRTAIKDFAHYYATFTAPKGWTKVSIPFTQFAQPSDWGNKVPVSWNDVENITFMPGTSDADYDFSIDDLTLTK